MASSSPEDIGGSSDAAPATESSDQPTIAKEDLIELIRAVKFKNPDFSQRQVYQEIVTEIPTKFPQYADSLNSNTLCLNDVKKAWKKAILQQQKQQDQNSNNNNSDLAERLRKMTTNPEVYTVGLNKQDGDLSSTGSSMARDYVAKFLEEQEAANSAQQRQLLEDYVHVFLDVPMDVSGGKPHQALINFQNKPKGAAAKSSNSNNKKKKGKKKGTTASTATTPHPEAPFEDAIVVKIQMAAPMGPDDTAKHPMLLYDQSRKFKTFVHPDGTLTAESDESEDGYSRLARWIRSQGVGGALGATGGTKAYFYARRTGGGKSNQILSIYIHSLAPP
eukprot:CAMPEP_0116140106 /NCGR_PEP_ID=MMETSP0329-20121206/13662_1 /TAXON_ID=697910 /ORGANISM="Pseudo-nitzschia arenysensis, Strain B593" /LENGTH=332 /DNA_ID=CAMNT_0003635181 /DNA_START=147 /DNA_END=1141 /DNA_ORIENTATION=+